MVKKSQAVAGSNSGPATTSTTNAQAPADTTTAGAATSDQSGTPETSPDMQRVSESDAANPVVDLAKQNVQEATPEAQKAPKQPSAPQPDPAFPREVEIVNETPIPYIVGSLHIDAGATVPVLVKGEDEITRMKTDCRYIMEMTPAYALLDPQPLRINDAI
jgi:hypothetical protein